MPAKKSPKGRPPMITTETDMKVVRLELPPDVHRAFRIAAAEDGVSMAVLARKAVDELLARRKGGK